MREGRRCRRSREPARIRRYLFCRKSDRAIAAIEAEECRFQIEQQRWATEERQREAQRAEELKRLEVEREKIAAEK